jgi:hypothetical protein
MIDHKLLDSRSGEASQSPLSRAVVKPVGLISTPNGKTLRLPTKPLVCHRDYCRIGRASRDLDSAAHAMRKNFQKNYVCVNSLGLHATR